MKIVVIICTLLFALLVCAVLGVGHILSLPEPKVIGAPPAFLKATDVEFNGVHSWFSKADDNHKCVLLMHGIRSNRTSMVGRARFLREQGYAVLLIDLQAHGETSGDYISFGYHESSSAKLAVAFLRQQANCKKIASLGVSLGGAASLLGQGPLAVDAFILEAVYTEIETAVRNRLLIRIGALANVFAPLLYLQIPLLYDVDLASLRPINEIKQLASPVLIIAGTEDQHTTLQESIELFNAAPQPKHFWKLDGAAHVDFYAFDNKAYEQKVLSFLNGVFHEYQVGYDEKN